MGGVAFGAMVACAMPALACATNTSGNVTLGGASGAPCLDVQDGTVGTVTVANGATASIAAPITYFYGSGGGIIGATGYSIIKQDAISLNSNIIEIILNSELTIGGNLNSNNRRTEMLLQNISNYVYNNQFTSTVQIIVNTSNFRGDSFVYNFDNSMDLRGAVINRIINYGTINFTADAIGNWDATIDLIQNYGNIVHDLSLYQGSVSYPGRGILNAGGLIKVLENTGTIEAYYPVLNTGQIELFVNYGNLIGGAGYGVRNWGVINNFHNGSNLGMTGNLPEKYFVIIRGANDYGRLTWVNDVVDPVPNSTPRMRFGVSQYSTGLASGTYTAVLSNITSAEIDSRDRSGTIGRFAWTLVDPDQDNSWDLIMRWLGSDPANTLLALQSNSNAVRSMLSQRAAATTYALDYDCSVFDQHGFCVSVGARNTQLGSNYADSGETAGLLTAAYRLTPEFRIGGFIDQNLVSQSPVGVDPKNTQPMLGAFAV
jgi:hypothetical protein